MTKLSNTHRLLLVALVVFALVISFYWLTRYRGLLMEGDWQRMTASGEVVLNEDTITPAENAYPSGFGFPSFLAFASYITGLSIPEIQSIGSILMFAAAISAFVVFREFLQRSITALLATFFFLLLPDVQFYFLRGSHERFTWTFMLLLLYLLGRNFQPARKLTDSIKNVILFYILLIGMAGYHLFFTSTLLFSLLMALTFSILLNLVFRRFKRPAFMGMMRIQRLFFISISITIILFVIVTYLYEPARVYYDNINFFLGRFGVLFLGAEQSQEPIVSIPQTYNFVSTLWRSNFSYLLVTAPQWLLVIFGLISWFQSLRQVLFNRLAKIDYKKLILLLIFGSVGLQLGFSSLIDVFGLFAFNNLQVRLFVLFGMLACPFAADFILNTVTFVRNLKLKSPLRYRLILTAVIVFIFYSAFGLLLKSTNDPLVSNYWLFYSPTEIQGLLWTEAHVHNSTIWYGKNESFNALAFWEGYEWQPANLYVRDARYLGAIFPYVLDSNSATVLANRQQIPLAISSGSISYNTIYTNGDMTLSHRLPTTPYQR